MVAYGIYNKCCPNLNEVTDNKSPEFKALTDVEQSNSIVELKDIQSNRKLI